MFRTELCAVFLGAVLAGAAAGQNLRHGVWSADLVVVADVTGVRPLGNELFLWHLRPLRTLKGATPERITIVEQKRVGDRPKPIADGTRIYCLRLDRKVELPEAHGPFFRMTGFVGDHPRVALPAPDQDATLDPLIVLCETLLASESGASPREISAKLVSLALDGDGPACTEAVQALREREVLRDRIDAVSKSRLLSRAVGESEDAALKDALASLCAELRIDGVIEALCMSVENRPDDAFATTLGRLASHLHGEAAIEVLRPRIVETRDAKARDCLLLALGATQTDAALESLLRYRRINGPGKAVDAALRAHGSKRATDAIDER